MISLKPKGVSHYFSISNNHKYMALHGKQLCFVLLRCLVIRIGAIKRKIIVITKKNNK